MGESDERRFSFTRHIPFTLLSLVILSCFAIIFFRRVSFELTTDVPLLSIRGVLNDGNTSNVKSNIVINNTQLEYMKRRNSLVNWDDWLTEDDREVVDDADKNGTVIDFIIAGFPKCGTTTMEANLGNIAPMPIADVVRVFCDGLLLFLLDACVGSQVSLLPLKYSVLACHKPYGMLTGTGQISFLTKTEEMIQSYTGVQSVRPQSMT